MIFGIPRELKDHETRVGAGLIPRNVATLIAQGHTVYFQKGVMEPAGVSDEEFLKVGAKCVDTMEEIYEKCDFIGKFKDMTDADMKMPFKKGQIIMTAFHMAEGTAKPEQVKILADAGVTCISIETSRYPDGSRAMTRPMGEIAGRTAPLLGGQYLQRQYGGSGVSIVPVTGARRARVCILGGGHAGMCAAQTAEGLGAEVVVFDVNIQRLEYLRTVLKNTDLRFMSKTAFAEEVAKADVLINCIYAAPLGNPEYVFALVILCVFCSIAANLLVNYACGMMSVTRISTFSTIATICSAFGGVIFLGEPITWMTFLGSTIIIIGIWQVTRDAS